MIIKQFNFHPEPQQTWHTKSNNSKIFARSLRSRFLVVISAFININIDLEISKKGNLTSKHTKFYVCKNDCTCTCARNILSFYFLYVNEIAKNGCFVVKRYAVREAKTWRYEVRKVEIGRHAVRKWVSPAW